MPMATHRARLFRNGRNQAVRIPREFEMTAHEVVIYREDERLIIVPVAHSPTLAEVLDSLSPLDVDFPEIRDPPAHPEDHL